MMLFLNAMFDFSSPAKGLPTIGKPGEQGVIDWVGVVKNFTTLLLSLGAVIALLSVVMAGYKMATSSGDQSKLTTARYQLVFSLAGLIIAAGGFIIWKLILQFIGTENINFGL